MYINYHYPEHVVCLANMLWLYSNYHYPEHVVCLANMLCMYIPSYNKVWTRTCVTQQLPKSHEGAMDGLQRARGLG
jgi:hypothetical protein